MMALTKEQQSELDIATKAISTTTRMLVEDDVSPLAVCTALVSELIFIIKALPPDSRRDALCKLFSDNILKNLSGS